MDILGDLNASVKRQGVKLDARDWLDMGSEGWRKTSEKEKSLAFREVVLSQTEHQTNKAGKNSKSTEFPELD